MNWIKLKREIEYEAFAVPSFLLYTVFSVIPIIGSIVYSFTDWDGLSQKISFVGLSNYIKLITDVDMIMPAIRNSILYAITITVLFTILAIPLAVALDSRMKGCNLLRAVFFFPSVPSALVVGYMWSYMLVPSEYGPANMVLGLFGISPVNWLGDSLMANISIIFVSLWCFTGWHAVIYVANLQTISNDYYEAAKIDGANFLQTFRHITLPLLAPAISISCLFSLTGAFKLFDLPYALTGGGPGYSSHYIVQVIIAKGVRENNYGLGNALSVALFVLILSVSLLQQKIMQKREDNMQ